MKHGTKRPIEPDAIVLVFEAHDVTLQNRLDAGLSQDRVRLDGVVDVFGALGVVERLQDGVFEPETLALAGIKGRRTSAARLPNSFDQWPKPSIRRRAVDLAEIQMAEREVVTSFSNLG